MDSMQHTEQILRADNLRNTLGSVKTLSYSEVSGGFTVGA